jgi:hypothetical protein
MNRKQQIESVANAGEEYVGVVLVASQIVRSTVLSWRRDSHRFTFRGFASLPKSNRQTNTQRTNGNGRGRGGRNGCLLVLLHGAGWSAAGPLEPTCAYAAGGIPVPFSYISLFLCLGLLKTQSQAGEGRLHLLCSSCVVAVVLVARACLGVCSSQVLSPLPRFSTGCTP